MAKAKKLPSGNWRVNQYVGKDANGKRIYKSFTASTKKEAEYMAANYTLNGDHEQKPPAELTLAEAYDRYIESKSNVLSPSTIREYRSCAPRPAGAHAVQAQAAHAGAGADRDQPYGGESFRKIRAQRPRAALLRPHRIRALFPAPHSPAAKGKVRHQHSDRNGG